MSVNIAPTRRKGLLLLLASLVVSIGWGLTLASSMPIAMADFKAVYYGARCLLHGSDPYKESEFLHVYQAEGGRIPTDPEQLRIFMRAVPVCINLPSALVLVAPLALLPWPIAQTSWLILIAAGLSIAGYLMWQVGCRASPSRSLLLICILLANCESIFLVADTAGIVVSLCVIAVWCFLEGRFTAAGVVCLALSLLIKPHDAGLVWVYFLLAGGTYRKRALQTAAFCAVLAAVAVLWVSHSAPQWMHELHTNLATTSVHGGIGDPGPDSFSGRKANMVIDLQAAISMFRDEPAFYNPVSYLVCGGLLLVWVARTLRPRSSPSDAWLALAAVIPLTMLITYHRPHDAKLLLLAVPACAVLQIGSSTIGKIALLVTTTAIFFTGDIPLALLVSTANHFHISNATLGGKLLLLILTRPASLALFGMALFYLWVYVRHNPDKMVPKDERPGHIGSLAA